MITLKVLRNFLIILLSIICIILIPLILVYESLNTTILKPYESISYLNESGIYQDAEVVLEETIINKMGSLEIASFMPSTILNNLVSNSVTIDWISYFSKDIQTSLWKYITDDTDKISDISLTGYSIYIKEMASNEINTLTNGNSSFLEDTINTKIDQLMPESINLNDYFSDYTNYIEKVKGYYQTMKVFEVVIFLLLAFIIIFVAILSANLKKTLSSLGIIFSITGILTLLAALFLNVIDKQFFYAQLQNLEFYGYFESSVTKLMDLLVNDITMNLSMISFVVMIVGVFLLLISKVLKTKTDKSKSLKE